MKLNLQIARAVLAGVSLAGLLTGCALSPKETIIRNTTEFNLVAERTGNEMLLLNIVRASQRRPMYFTSFAKLTGSRSYELGTGSNTIIPFGSVNGGGEGTAYSFAPTITYKNSPVFDVQVLDTKEFTCGIMTPVPMTTVEYFWRQGWPKEMLLYLFVKRIEVDRKDGGRPEVYDNDLEDEVEFDGFRKLIQDQKWSIVEDPNVTKIGVVDTKEAPRLKDLIEVQKAGLKLRPVAAGSTKEELVRIKERYSFHFEPKSPGKGPSATLVATESKPPMDPKPATDVNTPPAPKSSAEAKPAARSPTSAEGKTAGDAKPPGEHGRVYLRSPEAILYYLGEIVRAERRGPDYGPMIDVWDPEEGRRRRVPLFYARQAKKGDAAPCVAVPYEGIRYVIPADTKCGNGDCAGRSMHVLSLVSQLIGMQKKSELVPVTGTVNVIGQ